MVKSFQKSWQNLDGVVLHVLKFMRTFLIQIISVFIGSMLGVAFLLGIL